MSIADAAKRVLSVFALACSSTNGGLHEIEDAHL